MDKLLEYLKKLLKGKAKANADECLHDEKEPYLKNLLASGRQAENSEQGTANTPPVGVIPKTGRIYNPFDWVRWVLLWTNAQVVCLGLLALFLWAAVFILQSRDYRVIDLPKPLISRVYDAIDTTDGISDADIERNTHLVLHLLNSFTYASPPNLSLLQGIASPDIISSSEGTYSINKRKMDDSSLIQNINITSIPRIQKNAKNRRISVLVEGHISVLTQPNNPADLPSRTVPYRAELTYIVRPASELSGGEKLYLLQITEAAGTRDVSVFDEAFDNTKNHELIQ